MQMNILITCLNFKNTTGSELYFYDLACGFKKIGHNVSILSNVKGGKLWELSERRGIKCFDFTQAPNDKFDIILASHRPVIDEFCKQKLYDPTPIISINHSEIIPLEYPIIDDRIIHYVAIRESIMDFIENRYFIPKDNVSLIYNPINTDKLLSAKKRHPKKKTVLFAGTIDYLRKESMLHLCKRANEEDFNLWFVGSVNGDNYLLPELNENISWEDAKWNIQDYISGATHTAGIQFGRTEIEGYFFGLNCIRYIVNSEGKIQDVIETEPPHLKYLFENFSYVSVARKMEDLIQKLITKN